VVVWQFVIRIVFVLCGGVLACYKLSVFTVYCCVTCHTDGLFTVLWCGSVLRLWIMNSVFVWDHAICSFFILCYGVAACLRLVLCTISCCGSVFYLLCEYCVGVAAFYSCCLFTVCCCGSMSYV